MGAYDANPRNDISYNRDNRSQWASSMGSGNANLVDRFSGLGLRDPSSQESLFQVIKAVEAAESTIKQQLEENNQLRTELQRRTKELEKYKSDTSSAPSLFANGPRDGHIPGVPFSPTRSEEDRVRWNNSPVGTQGTLVIHQNAMPKNEVSSLQTHMESQQGSDGNKANGTLDFHPGGRIGVDNIGFSQFSSPSSRSFSPTRCQKEREVDPLFSSSEHGLMPMSDANNATSLWKQELALKVREHEEEVVQLRKHLADYSMKESQIRNEKSILEKRIAYMRLAFDQQQQDLVDAASKALSYRQDIIEENIRLTYALQAAQQERSTFISCLLPLLQDYGFQPSVPDAQSIVNNLKVLFKHLQEKLIMTETKLKESQYQFAPWRSDALNNSSSFMSQSPTVSFGAALTVSNTNGLEIVPQLSNYHAHTPISSPLNAHTTRAADWDTFGHYNNHSGLNGATTKNLEQDNLGRSSPPASRNSALQDNLTRLTVSQGDAPRFSEEQSNNPRPFDDFSGNEMVETVTSGAHKGRDLSAHLASGNSPSMAPTLDDPGSTFSPYLPPVLEEPSSSFSEAADDDPLPAIEGLQIVGEAFPGQELQACGYSINGTTSCNFEWVRYLEDGSVQYIAGAKQPNYLVTADDVDSYLAIEVQPLDNRKRKGELVKVFANEQTKITCDPEMQEQIEKILFAGHASFEISLSAGCLDIWEPAILAIKREGYSVKCNGPRGVVVAEKFLPTTAVTIPFGHTAEISILSSSGIEHLLRTSDSNSLRDMIVLILRLFIMRAIEKRKGKKKGLFFTK